MGKVMVDAEVWQVPNFLRIKALGAEGSIDIAEIDDAELSRLADEWKRRLLENAAKRRTSGPTWGSTP